MITQGIVHAGGTASMQPLPARTAWLGTGARGPLPQVGQFIHAIGSRWRILQEPQ